MARSAETIYNTIIQTIQNQPSLADKLTSTSDMALFKLLAYQVALAESINESLWDIFKIDLENIKLNTPIANERWWLDRLLNQYQYSTNPDFGIISVDDNFIPAYKKIDENLRIIKFASVLQNDNSRRVTIKVAKADINNEPTQLSIDELDSVKSFVNELQIVGLDIKTVSFARDLIKMDLQIFYDGQYIQSVVSDEIKEVIKLYFKNLKFDGSVIFSDLFVAIKAIEAVVDIKFNSIYGRSDEGAYEPIDIKYLTTAGFCKLDENESLFTFYPVKK